MITNNNKDDKMKIIVLGHTVNVGTPLVDVLKNAINKVIFRMLIQH